MTEQIRRPDCETLGEYIKKHFPGFEIYNPFDSAAPLHTDITNGLEVCICDNSRYDYGVTVIIYPYVKWTDGCYRPCDWGLEYRITLKGETLSR